jgi:hypothetical protein
MVARELVLRTSISYNTGTEICCRVQGVGVGLLSSLPTLLFAVVLISVSPGPAVALILRRAALQGFRSAVPTVLGLEAGLYTGTAGGGGVRRARGGMGSGVRRPVPGAGSRAGGRRAAGRLDRPRGLWRARPVALGSATFTRSGVLGAATNVFGLIVIGLAIFSLANTYAQEIGRRGRDRSGIEAVSPWSRSSTPHRSTWRAGSSCRRGW